MATTNYQVTLFFQVPDEGETEAWQIEQALRDAAEEHLWQVVNLTVVPTETRDYRHLRPRASTRCRREKLAEYSRVDGGPMVILASILSCLLRQRSERPMRTARVGLWLSTGTTYMPFVAYGENTGEKECKADV